MRPLYLLATALSLTNAFEIPPDGSSLTSRQKPPKDEVVIGTKCLKQGSFACANSSSTIVTCSGSNIWVKSADCGYKCCRHVGLDSSVRCDCRTDLDLEVKRKDPTPSLESPDTALATPLGYCETSFGWRYKHGETRCAEDLRSAEVCGPDDKWNLVADCGEKGCCKIINLQAYCDCRDDSATNKVEKKGLPEPDHSDPRSVSKIDSPDNISVDIEPPNNLVDCLAYGEHYSPGQYVCGTELRGLYVCTLQGTWRLSADCGKGCCAKASNHQFYCRCPGWEEVDEPREIDPPTRADIVRRNSDFEARSAECRSNDEQYTPGQNVCGVGDSNIFVCTLEGDWIFSIDCGGSGCCVQNSNGTAYCRCRSGDNEDSKVSTSTITLTPSRDIKKTVPVLASDAPENNEGTSCPDGKGHNYPVGAWACGAKGRAIYICSPTGQWRLSADCGGDGCCKSGPVDPVPYCDCRADQQNATLSAKREVAPTITSLENPVGCLFQGTLFPPGTWACGGNYRSIIICSFSGEWTLSADCGADGCCKKANGVDLPFCACRNDRSSLQAKRENDLEPSIDSGRCSSEKCEYKFKECEQWGSLYLMCLRRICALGCGECSRCHMQADASQPTHAELNERNAASDFQYVGERAEATSFKSDELVERVICSKACRGLIKKCNKSKDCIRKLCRDPHSRCGKCSACGHTVSPSSPNLKLDEREGLTGDSRAKFEKNEIVPSEPFQKSVDIVCSIGCKKKLKSCNKSTACIQDVCTKSRYSRKKCKECKRSGLEEGSNAELNEHQDVSCTPPGFDNEDACLNVCGPRWPPCYRYCTCQTGVWPLASRKPTTESTSARTSFMSIPTTPITMTSRDEPSLTVSN